MKVPFSIAARYVWEGGSFTARARDSQKNTIIIVLLRTKTNILGARTVPVSKSLKIGSSPPWAAAVKPTKPAIALSPYKKKHSPARTMRNFTATAGSVSDCLIHSSHDAPAARTIFVIAS
eukprot:TRINITY_DN18797_c0_g1_i1.p4 TRINITY_DN18797_c0_g1~~TRINITY_DN18797_c0_g1_i1.p4  ORF type:complete len:120 (+),score=9.59 TRINITY_DN18797_c0_g1_i1:803-1162(+)